MKKRINYNQLLKVSGKWAFMEGVHFENPFKKIYIYKFGLLSMDMST